MPSRRTFKPAPDATAQSASAWVRPTDAFSFLPAGGAAGELIRSIDWATTALGPVADWPQSLRTSVSICLNSRFPMLIWWGPELVKIYNDAYIPMCGAKHPWALGQAGRDVWPEIWQIIGPMLDGVLQRGEATWSEDIMLPLARRGFTEECYFTFSYSPIHVENGAIGGVFTAVSETSAKVIGGRRLSTLHALGQRGAGARCADDAVAAACTVLETNRFDLPFTLTYLCDPSNRDLLRLSGTTGFAAGECGAAAQIDLSAAAANTTHGLARALAAGEVAEIGEPVGLTGAVPSPWPEATRRAAALPLVSAQGERAGVLVAGISPRLALEEHYRSFLTLVAGQIGSAIASAEAYAAERRRAEGLAQLDASKTAFFANVSHEFRTPITLMLGPLEDVLADPDAAAAAGRERIEIAHRNALRLQKLVNTLLEFSRIEAGRVQAAYRPTDLARFTAELASVFRSSVERAGLRYVVRTTPLPEAAYVDREMWEKIVLNLLSNAFKFTFEGEIELSLASLPGKACLRVRDTGTGIPAAQLPHLFQRFHRVEGAVGRSQEGSGIGLALIQELIRLHGGTIGVTSEWGRGTTFDVQIPLGMAHLPAQSVLTDDGQPFAARHAAAADAEAQRWLPDAYSARGSAAPAQGAAAVPRPRVLLADDNADMRAYIQGLLSPAWDVEAVSNGEDALAAARARSPDLILSDVMMPRLDGFGLLRRLQESAATSRIPVLLLSARADEESRIEGLRAGAGDYLVKPFSAKELLARAQTQLQIGRFQAAVERERAKLSGVFAQAPVGIALLEGPQHVFRIANPVYCSLLFGGPRDFLGKPVHEAVPESVAQGFVALLDQVYATGRPHVGNEMPIDLVQPDGSSRRFYLNFVYQPLRDESDAVRGIVAVVHEVTERVNDRRRLQDNEQRLENTVADLEQERELRERFVAMLTHDLRTPLHAAKMCAQVIRKKAGDPDVVHNFAARIADNIGRADDLITNLLDANRLKAGERLAIEVEACHLEEIAADTLVDLSTLHGDRFALQARGSIEGHWSRSGIRRILENLCLNGIKYGTPYKPVRVTLLQADDRVIIEVHNEGAAISAADREKLFQPFKRIGADQGARPGGWGLGLTLVKGIAEAHGGFVAVDSDPLRGTTFRVSLPRDARSAAGQT